MKWWLVREKVERLGMRQYHFATGLKGIRQNPGYIFILFAHLFPVRDWRGHKLYLSMQLNTYDAMYSFQVFTTSGVRFCVQTCHSAFRVGTDFWLLRAWYRGLGCFCCCLGSDPSATASTSGFCVSNCSSAPFRPVFTMLPGSSS